MFKRMEITEYIYEGAVNFSYKQSTNKLQTVLFTAGKIEEKLTPHILTTR